ncbi:MAG: recombinase family protein [Ruminococcaceae bacterium]|nr:recombinase family protein [Oscillospiraceae bacterium]
MNIHEIRQQMKFKSIYEISMRVTFYARVSSEKDEQLNSLDNQIAYYTDLIKKNPNWEYIPGYIDEGISGISTQKRENFNQMIADSQTDKFDFVITKEISRFARNTLDSIRFTRELLQNGVGVFFQNDNINTLDEDSELRLSIMSSIAQDELRKLSSRIKFGHQQAIKNHVVLGNSRIFGYDKKDKRLVINEEEAKMVRELFELYATDQYSMKQIEDLFWSKGYRNRNGNKIAHSTMANTISNPKYKGYYVGNKVKVIDMFTKKQHFLPPEEWVMFKDETGEIVPAIVSEELWDAANAVLERRSKDVKKRQNICNHANLLTGKLFCTHCGKAYYRRDSVDRQGNKNSKWVCSGKINNGADSCPSFAIYEEEIKPILFDVFNETSPIAEDLIESYIEMYRTIEASGDLAREIERLQKELEHEQKKKRKILDYNLNGDLSDEEYLQMNRECKERIESLEKELAGLLEQQNSKEDFKKHIEEIRTVLTQAKQDAAQGLISKEFITKYIDRIFVTPEGDCLRLEIKIFTGKTCEKYLSKIRGRTGHMSKKMIEDYENRLK